jgi:hypothetical protein
MGCVFGGLRKLLSLCVKVSINVNQSRIVGDKKIGRRAFAELFPAKV